MYGWTRLVTVRTTAVVALLGLLVGCTHAPLTVALQDFEVPIATVQSGQAVFTQQNFNRPPIALTNVALEGNLTYQQGDVSLVFYTSDGEPCAPTGGSISAIQTIPTFRKRAAPIFKPRRPSRSDFRAAN